MWDWYYEGEEGQREINYMEENWNDYNYDNSWDWNDNSYEDTDINESRLTIGHIRQAKSLLHKRNSKSLLGKKTTHTTSWNDHSKSFQQFLQEDATQLHFDIAAATQQQRNKKIEAPSHTTSCTPTSSHTVTCESTQKHLHMLARRTTRQTYHFLSMASSMFTTGRTTSGSCYPTMFVMCSILSSVHQDNLIEDMDSTSIHDTAPSHRYHNKHTSSDTQYSATYEQKRSTPLQDLTSTQ